MSHSGGDLSICPLCKDQRKSSHCAQGEEGKRTSWIVRATILGFIYTLDVLLSKLLLSVSVSSNDKVLTCCSLLIAYLIVLTDAFVIKADYTLTCRPINRTG